MAVYMKVFKNPNSDFQYLLWANQGEISALPMAIIEIPVIYRLKKTGKHQ
ncbi:hypothetical protein [Desulfobacula phenolica]|nr:hypothetical protein [Desulfobacula phenolica]